MATAPGVDYRVLAWQLASAATRNLLPGTDRDVAAYRDCVEKLGQWLRERGHLEE